jgi:CUG-BP- and ETR3-like factor
MDEDALRPFFERYGSIFEITVIRDKSTKAHRGLQLDATLCAPLMRAHTHLGCAFLTFCQRQSAFDAIDALHDKMRLGSVSFRINIHLLSANVFATGGQLSAGSTG